MQRLWRLYRAAYGPGLDGAGGTFAEGRWHTKGERVVYFGASAAIVVLERLAHTDADLLPADLRLGRFEFSAPAAVTGTKELGSLSKDWAQHESATQRAGSNWLRERSSCLLVVPSAILPEESNFVFNPLHPDAQRLQLVSERSFTFDSRLV